MDRAEKLKYEQSLEQYLDDNKIYDLFEKLFKELVVNQPENPIDYLIERLKRKETKRVFITGYPGAINKEKKVSLAVGGTDYENIVVGDLLDREIKKKLENAPSIEKNYNVKTLVDDDIVIDLVRTKIIDYEEKNKSYIVEGFPRNREQAIFLQSIGLLPDNLIILKTSREKAEENLIQELKEKNSDKTEEELKLLAKASIDEAELNIRAVEDIFNGFYCELPIDQYENEDKAFAELQKLLTFKSKSNAARRPPRIILACPPSCGKESIARKLADKLKIVYISVIDLLKKEIHSKNANSLEILNAVNNNDLVDDKFVFKLIEDRLSCSDCIINGWLLTGFPMRESQINYIDSMNPSFKPSFKAMIFADDNLITEKASKILVDPRTGKKYTKDSDEYKNLTNDILSRLVPRQQDRDERLKKRIENWKTINDILVNNKWEKFNGEEKESVICQEIEAKLSYNSSE